MRTATPQKSNPLHINKPLTKALVRLLEMPVDAELPMRTKGDKLAAKMYTRACQNSFKDTKEILDRVEGKVAQVIAGDPLNPIKIDLAVALEKAIKMRDITPTKGSQLIEHAIMQAADIQNSEVLVNDFEEDYADLL